MSRCTEGLDDKTVSTNCVGWWSRALIEEEDMVGGSSFVDSRAFKLLNDCTKWAATRSREDQHRHA